MKNVILSVVLSGGAALTCFADLGWAPLPYQVNAFESYEVGAESNDENVSITIYKNGAYLESGSGSPWYDEQSQEWHAFKVSTYTSDSAGEVQYSAENNYYDNISGSVMVLDVPVVRLQPISRTRNTGASVTFEAEFSGGTPIYLQWRKNGVNISGATARY